MGRSAYFLAPVRETAAAGVPSGRCFALQVQALERALPGMPAFLRAPTRNLQSAVIAYDRGLAATPPMDGICMVTAVGANGSSSECGMTISQIAHGVLPSDDNGTFVGVAPDGVASVTLRIPGYRGHAARSLSATVHANMYVARAAPDVPVRPGSPTVVWRAADGRVLKTFSEPKPASLNQICHRHPDACVPPYLFAGASAGSSSSTSTSASHLAAPKHGG